MTCGLLAAQLSGMLRTMADVSLDKLSKDDLYQLATDLAVQGRSGMTRKELLEAVSSAQAAAEAEASKAAGEAADEAAGGRPEQEQLTVEEGRKIMHASEDQLAAVVQAPNLEEYKRKAIENELRRRAAKRKADEEALQAQTPIERWRVSKGGRYVGKDGFITTLPVGSLVTPLTHDLAHVRQQKIELERCESVTVQLDQLGRPVSEVR